MNHKKIISTLEMIAKDMANKEIVRVEKDPAGSKLDLDPKLKSIWIYEPEENQYISVRGRASHVCKAKA